MTFRIKKLDKMSNVKWLEHRKPNAQASKNKDKTG